MAPTRLRYPVQLRTSRETARCSGTCATLSASSLHLGYYFRYRQKLIHRRMHEVAPVTSRGSDEVEIPGQAHPGERTRSGEQTMYKWALLWRTMILSSLGKTMYSYCRHIRTLNLPDLREMLEDNRFRGNVRECILKPIFRMGMVNANFLQYVLCWRSWTIHDRSRRPDKDTRKEQRDTLAEDFGNSQ